MVFKQQAGWGWSCLTSTRLKFQELKEHLKNVFIRGTILNNERNAWFVTALLLEHAAQYQRFIWASGGLCAEGFVITLKVRARRWTQLTFDPQHFYLWMFLVFTFLTWRWTAQSSGLTLEFFHPFLKMFLKEVHFIANWTSVPFTHTLLCKQTEPSRAKQCFINK